MQHFVGELAQSRQRCHVRSLHPRNLALWAALERVFAADFALRALTAARAQCAGDENARCASESGIGTHCARRCPQDVNQKEMKSKATQGATECRSFAAAW